MKGRCIIVAAGDLTVSDIAIKEEDYVIAVDGGLAYCDYLKVEPDMIIGDFDSIGEEGSEMLHQLELQVPERICRLNPIKDDTDMLSAIKHGLGLGYKDFRLYGALGGRIDHSLANIQCLLYIKNRGAAGYIMDGNAMTFIIQNEAISLQDNLEGYLSVFALGERAEGVTIQGMKYSLESATITNDFPIGISNEFIGKKATISVENGSLVCIIQYVAD